MFLVCASSVPTIAVISLRRDSVAMITSFPSQVTVTWGNRTLRESWPLGPVTRRCMPSRLAFTPSGILTFLTAAIFLHHLVDVPEQFATDALFPRLFVGNYSPGGRKYQEPEVLAGQVL